MRKGNTSQRSRKPSIKPTAVISTLTRRRENVRRLVDAICQYDDEKQVRNVITLLMAVADPQKDIGDREDNLFTAITYCLTFTRTVQDSVERVYNDPPKLRVVG